VGYTSTIRFFASSFTIERPNCFLAPNFSAVCLLRLVGLLLPDRVSFTRIRHLSTHQCYHLLNVEVVDFSIYRSCAKTGMHARDLSDSQPSEISCKTFTIGSLLSEKL
jgi:hypothetical protein